MPQKGLRPHTWKYKDPKVREQNVAYMRMKAQANFRNEEFDLTFEEYQELWEDYWELKGRGREDYCLTRDDSTAPWNKTNTRCVQRLEYLQRSIAENGNIHLHRHKTNEAS